MLGIVDFFIMCERQEKLVTIKLLCKINYDRSKEIC